MTGTITCPIQGCDVTYPDADIDYQRDLILEHFGYYHSVYEQRYHLLDYISDIPRGYCDFDECGMWCTDPGHRVQRVRELIEDHPFFVEQLYVAHFGSIEETWELIQNKPEVDGIPLPVQSRPIPSDLDREDPFSLSDYDRDLYGPNYPDQRREALERDDLTCRVCETDHDSEPRIQIHHIRPASSFHPDPDYEAMNALSNLITLCPSCHGRLEGNWPDVDPPTFAERGRSLLQLH